MNNKDVSAKKNGKLTKVKAIRRGPTAIEAQRLKRQSQGSHFGRRFPGRIYRVTEGGVVEFE